MNKAKQEAVKSTTEAGSTGSTTAADAAMQKKNVEATKKDPKALADKGSKQKAVSSTTQAAATANTTAADAAKQKANSSTRPRRTRRPSSPT